MANYDISTPEGQNSFTTSSDKINYLKQSAKDGHFQKIGLQDMFFYAKMSTQAGDSFVEYLLAGGDSPSIFENLDYEEEDDQKLIDAFFSQLGGHLEATAGKIIELERGSRSENVVANTIVTLVNNDYRLKLLFIQLVYSWFLVLGDQFFYQSWETLLDSEDNLEAVAGVYFLESDFVEAVLLEWQALSNEVDGVSVSDAIRTGSVENAAAASAASAVSAVAQAAAAPEAAEGEEVIEKSFAEEDLRNFLQCALLKDFINTYESTNDGSFGSIKSIETNVFTNAPYKERVVPLSMDDPGLFLNYCNFPKDMKTAFVRKSRMTKSSIVPSFKYMRPIIAEDNNVNRYITGHEEIDLELNQDTGDVTFKNLTIDFDGTNPSTARKDVKVKIELQLKNLGVLDYNIASLNQVYLFELYKLITVPYGVQQDSSVGGSIIRNQYSPDYNRIRMTLNTKMKANIVTKRNLDGTDETEERDFNKYQTYDLAMESHEINRSDEGVTLTLNYRGYFQSLLSHPFMDALATADVMTARIAADNQLSNLGNDCSTETIKEIIRINRMADLQNAKSHSWSKFINNISDNTNVKWRGYTCKNADLRTFAFTNSLNWSETESTLCTWTSTTATAAEDTLETLTTTQETMTDKKIKKSADGTFSWVPYLGEEAALEGDTISSAFTTVGSIMQVALESLYEGDTGSELHPKFKHLNLKFLVAPIKIKNPQNNTYINFNPLELPVDLLFFNQWFQSTIINKGITYYPVLTMIRDLIERLVNSMLFEMCFDNSMPDELPPILRTGFFNDNTIEPPKTPPGESGYGRQYTFNLSTLTSNQNRQRLFEYNPDNKDANGDVEPVYTYCVIYSQTRGSYITPSDLKNYKESPYIPVFQHGHRLIVPDGVGGDGPLSNVSFSKENMTGLKEARFFSSGGGGLNVLSNVYNLGFDLNKIGANVFIYPGQIIQFNLFDFDSYNDTWSIPDALSSIMGFGGFYVIKKTSIKIKNLSGNDFTIHYDALWSGNGAGVEFRRSNEKNVILETSAKCVNAFESAKTRYTQSGGDASNIQTSVESISVNNATQSGVRYYGSSQATNRRYITTQATNVINQAIEAYKANVLSNPDYKTTGKTIPFTSKVDGTKDRKANITIKGVYEPVKELVYQIKVGVVDKGTGIEVEYQVNINGSQVTYVQISR